MKNLNFIGIGGAYALELGGNCAYLKEGNKLFLIDCCEDATVKLKNKNALKDVNEIIVLITHTHADHIAGLGRFLWYCNFLLNIKPKIVSNSKPFQRHTKKLLKLLGVKDRFFEFVKPKDVIVDNCKVEMIPTFHTDKLDSFGIMFTDQKGKYYYTGDTKDFKNIKQLVAKDEFKRIYCEASWKSYDAHIEYEKLKEIKCNKLVLMHFEDVELYKLAIKDGFNVAKLE